MTDDQWNQQANQTGTAIEDHNDTVEDTRRKLVNGYARRKGVIEDTEDFMNEYRNQGLRQMQAVEDYLMGNQKDWEEAQKAIDAIAGEQGGEGLSRRRFLGLLAGTTGAAATGSYLAGITPGGGSGGSEPSGFSPGELNTWDAVEKCLSSEQEESVTEVVGRYGNLSRNDFRYSVETDGNVIMHQPSEDGYRPIAETRDNDFMCEINY